MFFEILRSTLVGFCQIFGELSCEKLVGRLAWFNGNFLYCSGGQNETDRAARKLLVKNDDAPRATRRAALGDVGNRVLRSTVNSVKEAQR